MLHAFCIRHFRPGNYRACFISPYVACFYRACFINTGGPVGSQHFPGVGWRVDINMQVQNVMGELDLLGFGVQLTRAPGPLEQAGIPVTISCSAGWRGGAPGVSVNEPVS